MMVRYVTRRGPLGFPVIAVAVLGAGEIRLERL